MAYDRYDTRGGSRERWRSDERFDPDRDYRARDDRGRHERGFFERAGDEIASWFGDDDADRRRRGDGRTMGRDDDHGRDYRSERGMLQGRDWDRDRDWDRSRRGEDDRDTLSSRGYRGVSGSSGLGFSPWGGGERPEHGERQERSYARRDDDYRPLTGDYSRSERERAFRDEPRGRDHYRQTSFAGSSEQYDPHYRQWRERQLDELDRDYDEYRRENQSRFESDFGGWRERRMQKRGLLGQVREHMEVVGSDGEHVGTVDRSAGDRIILTKSDPEAGGVHHSLSCTDIDRIEDDKVILDCKAEEARQRWRDESRDRALFEREDQGQAGPGILGRSFSGTYL